MNKISWLICTYCRDNSILRVLNKFRIIASESLDSVHEGEPLLVLLWLLGGEFFLEANLFLLLVVVLKGRFDPDSAGHHSSNALSEGVNFEEMDSSVESIDFFGVEFSNKPGQILIDVVFEDIVFEFGGFFDFVVHDLEDFQNEFEVFLINIGDVDLNKKICTLLPFSRASASSMYFMAPACFSSRLYYLPSTVTWTIFYLYQKNLTICHLNSLKNIRAYF